MSAAAFTLATWFGCGYVPIAPGTAASFVAVAITFAVAARWHVYPLCWLVPAILLMWPGIWAAGIVAKHLKIEDPRLVVVDEVIGQWITISGAARLNWKSWIAAFFLFRILDIWKPFPVRQLEALPSGTGIVADDAMAGVYGALVLFVAGCFNLY